MNRTIVFFILTVFLIIPSWGEEVVYIKGGEIEGTVIGSFYISKTPINNQNFFSFMQTDRSQKAPRSWEGNSPPDGEEFNPVVGITYAEAQAYARSLGWFVPGEKMWELAKGTSRDIEDAEYPWAEEGSDNNSSIYIARYHTPANIVEDKFKSIDQKLRRIPSVTTVNKNSAKIRTLDRQVSGMEEKINAKFAAFEKILASQKSGEVEQLLQQIQELNSRLATVEEKQKQLLADVSIKIDKRLQVVDQMQKNSSQYVAAIDELKIVQQTLTKNINDVKAANSIANSQYQQVAASLQKANEKIVGLQRSVKIVSGQLANSAKSIAKVERLYRNSKDELEKEIVNAKSTLATEMDNYKQVLQKDFTEKQAEFDQKLSQIGDLSSKISECEEDIRRLDNLCPSFPDGGNYQEAIGLMESSVQEVKASITTIKAGIRRGEIKLGKDIEELRKRDNNLVEDQKKLEEKLANINKRDDLQGRKITELVTKVTEVETANTNLLRSFDEATQKDKEHNEKLTSLEISTGNLRETVVQQKVEDKRIKNSMNQMTSSFVQQANQIMNLNNSVKSLVKKDDELSKTLEIIRTQVKSEFSNFLSKSKSLRKHLSEEINKEIDAVSQKTEKNYAKITGIKSDIGSMRSNFRTSLKTMEKEVERVNKKNQQLATDFSIAATQMRQNVVEIAQKALDLFQNSTIIGSHSQKNIQVVQVTEDLRKKLVEELKKGLVDRLKKELVRSVEQTIAKGLRAQLKDELSSSLKPQLNKEITESVLKELDKELKQRIGQNLKANIDTTFQKLQGELKRLETKIKRDLEKTQQNSTNNNNVTNADVDVHQFAKLCYKMGQIYHKEQSTGLALHFMKLAADYSGSLQEPKTFMKKHWQKLNKPDNMVYIPGGKVFLGNYNDSEFPPRKKELSGFYIDRYEVTRGEFAEFVQKGYSQDKNWSPKGLKWRTNKTQPDNWKNPIPQEAKTSCNWCYFL